MSKTKTGKILIELEQLYQRLFSQISKETAQETILKQPDNGLHKIAARRAFKKTYK